MSFFSLVLQWLLGGGDSLDDGGDPTENGPQLDPNG